MHIDVLGPADQDLFGAALPAFRGVGHRRRDIVRAEGYRTMRPFTDEADTAAQALYRASGGAPSAHADAAFWWQLERVAQAGSADPAIQ